LVALSDASLQMEPHLHTAMLSMTSSSHLCGRTLPNPNHTSDGRVERGS